MCCAVPHIVANLLVIVSPPLTNFGVVQKDLAASWIQVPHESPPFHFIFWDVSVHQVAVVAVASRLNNLQCSRKLCPHPGPAPVVSPPCTKHTGDA